MIYDILSITEDHIKGFHDTLDFVAKERQYINFFEAPPIEETRNYVHKMIKDGSPLIVVVSEDKVVGWCDICKDKMPISNHCGTLGIGLLPDFRGKGIGKQLMAKTIETAFSSGMTRIQLTVKETNKNAIELYKNLGFEIEGYHKDSKLIDGIFISTYSMALVRKK